MWFGLELVLGRFGVNIRVTVSGRIRDRYGVNFRVWVRDMVRMSFMFGYRENC